MYSIRVTAEKKGKRIDKLLAEELPQFPRAALQKLFSQDLILLNERVIKPGHRLKEGDLIHADLSILDFEIKDIDLPIVYEDSNIMVIDKPPGVISHARGKYFDEPSVASFIRQKTHQKGERAGIVHRLDRATSGIMITAKNWETLSFLQKQFSDRKVKKTYLAIIENKMPSDRGLIDMPIGRNPKIPKTFHATELGKSATTRYETIKSNEKYSLLKLSPETGRTHQLRVHLKELGHPIVGDELYNGKTAKRLMLHAQSLEITIPGSKRMTFEANTPEEFKEHI